MGTATTSWAFGASLVVPPTVNGLLIVAVNNDFGASSRPITSMSLGSITLAAVTPNTPNAALLTFLQSACAGFTETINMSFWYALAPAAGTYTALTVSATGYTAGSAWTCIFDGVNQTTPFRLATLASSIAGPNSWNEADYNNPWFVNTTSAVGDVVFIGFASQDPSHTVRNGGTTIGYDNQGSSYYSGAGYYAGAAAYVATEAGNTFNQLYGNIVAISLIPAPASGLFVPSRKIVRQSLVRASAW